MLQCWCCSSPCHVSPPSSPARSWCRPSYLPWRGRYRRARSWRWGPPLSPQCGHVLLQEETSPVRPPLSLFPSLYYPGGCEGGGGGMLSQVLMSLSARHRQEGVNIKQENCQEQPALQLHHSPEISSTQGTVLTLSTLSLSHHSPQRSQRTARASAATRRRRTWGGWT